MKYSKNQAAAKEFLRWISSKEIFDKWFVSQQGYTTGPTKIWENHHVWSVDPGLAPFKQIPVTGRLGGYAGSPNQKAAEVQTKYIVVDCTRRRSRACRLPMRSSGRTERWSRSTAPDLVDAIECGVGQLQAGRRFELPEPVRNVVKAAKTLALHIPPALLARRRGDRMSDICYWSILLK